MSLADGLAATAEWFGRAGETWPRYKWNTYTV